MVDPLSKDQMFINKLTDIVSANLGNENFGIEDLAEQSGMSHRSLSRKMQSVANKTINQFIREIRLRKALDMLQNEDLTVSEVTYKVGFSSPAYFNKCFHEYFGYPPGKIKKGDFNNNIEETNILTSPKKETKGLFKQIQIYILEGILILSVLIIVSLKIFISNSSRPKERINVQQIVKSIAVLPFKNLNDSVSNQYFLDGLMDEIMADLSKVEDLWVVSRISVEQYREPKMSASELAKKLNVKYIVEGSGQFYDNIFCLRVQLTDASNERNIWAKTYEQEINGTKDIFKIQSQVAQAIASELETTITPEEIKLLEKTPTPSLQAYDFYLRGKEELNKLGIWKFDKNVVKRAEILFHKAIEYDSTFAQAYTGLANTIWMRWWRDNSLLENDNLNTYLDSMLLLANISLSYNNQLTEAYRIKAEYFMVKGQIERAMDEYYTALKYDPGYGDIYLTIGGIYEELDMVKSLENMQKAASLIHGPILTEVLTSIGRCYYKAGLPEEGDYYLLETLKLEGDSDAYSDNRVRFKADIGGEYTQAADYFEKRHRNDTTNDAILQFLGYFNSLSGHYEKSLKYYEKYLTACKSKGQIFPSFNRFTHIGYAFLQNGQEQEAEYFFTQQIKAYTNRLKSVRPGERIYWAYPLAAVFACKGDKRKAYEYLKIFNQNPSFTLEWVQLLKKDPQFNSIRNEPEFQRITKEVESKYQAEHKRVRKWLRDQGRLLTLK